MNYTEKDLSSIIGDRFLHLYGNILPKTYINNNLKLTMSENTKRYLISSLTTFLTGFALVLLSQWDSITLASFTDGSLMGLVFVAVRAGVKALIEYLLSLKS